MKIHSLSKLLILPVVLSALGILAYGETTRNYDFTIWVIIPGLLFAVLLVFMPQIDYWWHTKHPIPLDPKVKEWLNRYSNFYSSLDSSNKLKFETRLSLYIEAREFKSVGAEIREVPEDIKGIIGSIPIMLTFTTEDFLLGDYDRIYLYKHPFPSPEYQFLHSVEVNHEDGIMLFSLEHLLPGMLRSDTFYNICLHAYCDAYLKLYPSDAFFTEPTEMVWEKVKQVSGLDKERILAIVGYKSLELSIVLLVMYHSFPEKMNMDMPSEYGAICNYLRSITTKK